MTFSKLIEEHKRDYPSAAARENEPMSRHTTLKIGGKARAYFEPASAEELKSLILLCEREEIPYLILGNGSNVLFTDRAVELAVISTVGLSEAKCEGELITAGAGATLSKIAALALKNSLAGFECLQGIPGTLGGGIFMNAGAYGGEIKDVIESVTVFEDGSFREYSNAECGFSYRHSAFESKNAVIISAKIRLNSGERDEIKAKMRELSERRREKQPLEYPSAGSTFKRPQGAFAAQLIEEAGLKGRALGGAQVSEKHAGFLINRGNASFEDFYGLMEIVRKEVYDRSGVLLEPEVRIIR